MDQLKELFDELVRRGVQMSVQEGRLTVSAAKGVLTDELRSRVAASKSQLMQALLDATPGRSEGGSTALVQAQPQHDHEPFALSDLQLGFFMADDPYMEFHVRPHCYMEFDHVDLDLDRYEHAWNATLRLHARELCRVDEQGLLETLRAPAPVRIPVQDLRGLAPAEVARALQATRQQMERQELPLDRWPWFDLRASRWNDEAGEHWRLHYNHNNFFIDGYGTTVLLGDVQAHYRNPQAAPIPCSLSYRDAVLALEALAVSEQGRSAQHYWTSRLEAMPPPPPLPLRAQVSRRSRSRLERREAHLAAPLWERFKAHAAVHGITPSNAVTAAYAAVLATYANCDHFILSEMVTRRMAEVHPDMTRMLGNFVSLYPLEVRLDPSLSFAGNALRLQDQVLSDMKHLQYGGMRVMQALNRMKGGFGTAPSPFVVGSGLLLKNWVTADYTVLETSQTLLDHQFFQTSDGRLHVVWDLLEQFFPQGLIDEMWQVYQALLQRLASDERTWQERHLANPPPEALQARERRNDTSVARSECLLHEPLHAQAAAHPDALVLQVGEDAVTAAQLAAWSARIAGRLRRLGVQRGELVAVMLPRNACVAAAAYGVLAAGAAYVPIAPELPAQRRALLLADTRARFALTDDEGSSLALPEGVQCVRVDGLRAVAPPEAGDLAIDGRRPDELAYVIYTSGSTGVPKGVMIDHRGAANTIADINARFAIGRRDVLFGVSAFNFDLSVYDLFGAVQAGARLVYPDPARSLDPGHWLDRMLEHGVTVWNSVPALMALLVEAADARGCRLTQLRLVMLSGDKIPLELPDAVRRVAPNAKLVSLGGATEASIWSIHYPIDRVDPEWLTVPYGYPMENQSWHVLDRLGHPCPTWVAGELCIGGAGLAQGYWGDPERTARSFVVQGPGGQRLYRTGDLGRYWPDGTIEWLGRSDFQVKIQGHRIELGEIEAALRAHPWVREAVVLVQDEQPRRRLVGHVALQPDAPVSAGPVDGTLQSFLHDRLPPHMVPTAWVAWTQWPLTANGKVDRQRLGQQRASAPAAAVRAREAPEPPATPTELRVLAAWKHVLSRDDIGVADDFFDLGGVSFDAIRIFAELRRHYASSFTLGDIWTLRSVRALAGALDDRTAGADTACVIVELNAARTGVPLILVHPAGGSVLSYRALANALARPVLGVQAGPGLLRSPDIRALAGEYLAALQTQRPALFDRLGAVDLAGWSTGALLAFEMAQQLERGGTSVRCLTLLDGPSPAEAQAPDDALLVSWFLQDLALDLPLQRLADLAPLPGSPRDTLTRAAAAVGLRERSGLEADALLDSFQTFSHLVRAALRYRPAAAVRAPVRVLRVTEDVVDEFRHHPHRDAPDWGWARHAAHAPQCRRVIGNHYDFLQPPRLQAWLDWFDDVPADATR